MKLERVDCPASNCGRSVAIRYAAGSDTNAGRTVKHKKPSGQPCISGYFTWDPKYGWTLGFWRG